MPSAKLPEGFIWNFDGPERVDLVCEGVRVGKVKPMAGVWIAIIEPIFSAGIGETCVVPTVGRGQSWLRTWAEKRSEYVHATVLSHRLNGRTLAADTRRTDGEIDKPANVFQLVPIL